MNSAFPGEPPRTRRPILVGGPAGDYSPRRRTGREWCATRQRYEQVQALKAEGKSVTAVTRQLRLAPGTARRYYHAENADEVVAGSLAGSPSNLDDYKPSPAPTVERAFTNVQQLHPEIFTGLGFRGSYGTVYAHLAPMRGMPAPPAVPAPPKVRHVTS